MVSLFIPSRSDNSNRTSQGICPTFIMLAVSRGMTSSTGDYGASWSMGTRTGPATSHVVPMQFIVTTTTTTTGTKTQQESADVSSVREASFNKEEV